MKQNRKNVRENLCNQVPYSIYQVTYLVDARFVPATTNLFLDKRF